MNTLREINGYFCRTHRKDSIKTQIVYQQSDCQYNVYIFLGKSLQLSGLKAKIAFLWIFSFQFALILRFKRYFSPIKISKVNHSVSNQRQILSSVNLRRGGGHEGYTCQGHIIPSKFNFELQKCRNQILKYLRTDSYIYVFVTF